MRDYLNVRYGRNRLFFVVNTSFAELTLARWAVEELNGEILIGDER